MAVASGLAARTLTPLVDSCGGFTTGAGLILLAREICAMCHQRSDCERTIRRRRFGGFARRSKDVNQSRRLLSLAAVRDGMDRGSAAKIGGMDRQTLRDWVHRFNGSGLEGLVDNWTEGPSLVFSAEQLAEFAQIVEAGPDRGQDGVVRWRRLTLKRVIAERFGVDFHPRYMSESSSRNSASPPSGRGPVIQLRTSGPSRLSKRMARPVCKGVCRD